MLFALLKYPVDIRVTKTFPAMLQEYNKIIAVSSHPNNEIRHLPCILKMISDFENKWQQQDHIDHFTEALKQSYSRANAKFCNVASESLN